MEKKQVAPKVTASEVATVAEEAKKVVETVSNITLDSIVLDTEAKQSFMRVLEVYRRQNPAKFKAKEQSFIKKMLSL